MAENDGMPATDAEAEALWTEFLASPALMTMTDWEGARNVLFDTGGMRTVSATLLILTKSGQELVDLMHKGPDMVSAFDELAECAESRAESLRCTAEAMEAAAMRLRLALCDCGELRAA
jgi:hypothetical protein